MRRSDYEWMRFGMMMLISMQLVVWLFTGCSALDPRMSPPIRSAFEEWDRETGKSVYQCEVQEMRCRDGVVEVRSFNMEAFAPGEWRRVDPGHDWDVWVARWAWEGCE